MDTKALKQQLELLWQTEIGLPTTREIPEWMRASTHPVEVVAAIRKTGVKVRSAAETDRPMVRAEAVAYCRNLIRGRASDRRIEDRVKERTRFGLKESGDGWSVNAQGEQGEKQT